MIELPFGEVESTIKILKLDLDELELTNLAEERGYSTEQMHAVDEVLQYLKEKKIRNTIEMYLRTSRLPLKAPKTFENFDFEAINGKHVDRLKALPSLTAIRSHRNIAFIGPPGTGKTHLAQAYGYECCQNGLKTYFIKMSELRDKFTTARRNGKEASCLNGLIRPACLIIDELGHCEFDKENNIIFTSNKAPSLWKQNFSDDDDLLCALDRIFDDATVFNIRGDSFRGKRLENIALKTCKVSSSDSTE